MRLFADVPWLGAAAGRRRAGLRPRHQHRHRPDRVGAAVGGPDRPGRHAVRAVGLAVHARAQCGAAGCARAGSRPTWPWSRGGWTSSPTGPPRRTCRTARRSGRPYAAAARPGARPSGSSAAGRARAASPPAARRREPLGGPGVRAAASPPATAPGRTPTWRRPRRTSTTRWATSSGCAARPRGGDDMDAALDAILREGESGGGHRVSGPTAASASADAGAPARSDGPAHRTRRCRRRTTAARPGHGAADVLGRARRGPGGPTPGLPGAPGRPSRRDVEAGAAGAPDRERAGAGRHGRPRAAHPAPQGRRVVPVRRPLRARRRSTCTRRRPARPARSRASPTSSSRPGWSSSTGTRWWGPSAGAGSTWTCGSPRWPPRAPGTSSARSRSTCGGGRCAALPDTAGADLPRLVAAARRQLALG